MLFSSLIFLFAFLPLSILIYYISGEKYKNTVLLAFSLFFYAWGEPKYILLMLLSILANYLFGLLVDKYKESNKSKIYLSLAVIFNISMIGYYKYTDFIIRGINSLFSQNINLLHIIMPIGISFFTFQGMSYVIDVYRGDGQVQKNPLNVALYISLFPQLIAGPIVRYETVASEINYRKESLESFNYGVERFILGLGKKIIIANNMGFIADEIYNLNMDLLTPSLVVVFILSYTFQIYYDFSGYSDMAIGLGKIFGFNFLENFNYPYISRSITEFWRRWHISNYIWCPFQDVI